MTTTPYAFPASVYDQPANLLAVLGSFWTGTYDGGDQVESIVRAKCEIENQTMLDVLAAIATVSRFTVPIWRKENWTQIVLKQSEKNTVQTSILRYDKGYDYDAGRKYDTTDRPYGYAFPLPPQLADARVLTNRLSDPSLVWTRGLDFIIDVENQALVFIVDPFVDGRAQTAEIYVDGEITDTEAFLWLFRGDFDFDTAYRQFGYAVQLRMKSSKGYRDLLNVVFDSYVGGTNRKQILTGLSVVTGVPLVRESTETVEDIRLDNRGRLIITDQHVYRFDPSALVLVRVGETVSQGQALTDALQVDELTDGRIPPGLHALALGKGYILQCLYADLVFENKEFPLTVIENDPSGFTRVEWPLGGLPADVDRFFDEMHLRGVAAAEKPIAPGETVKTVTYPATTCDGETRTLRVGTMAHYMDRREVKIGEPSAACLPRMINPLQFLIANVLRNNATVARIRVAAMGPDGLGLQNLRHVQKLVPPHTALLLVLELSATADTVPSNVITESMTTFVGMTPLSTSVESVTERPRLRMVAGRCQ